MAFYEIKDLEKGPSFLSEIKTEGNSFVFGK